MLDVMSDWGAHHATLDAIQGLDVSNLLTYCGEGLLSPVL